MTDLLSDPWLHIVGNKRHGTPRTSSHCRAGSKTDACLNCLLHVAAVAVENLVEAQTVSVLTKCRQQEREQAGDYSAGYLPPRSARHVARGSLRSVRPRCRALFIIYRDGVNNNLFTGLPPLLPPLRDLLQHQSLVKYTTRPDHACDKKYLYKNSFI